MLSIDRCRTLLLAATPTIGIVVYPQMSDEFVRPTKAFCTAREGTGVGLLPDVGLDVSSVMLQAVESFVA
jgi:hypothetical protein